MKTPKARNNSGDDWKTPDWFYSQLDKIYHFDFDPCPYQADFDGLKISWGKRNFINPPYSRKLKEAFVRKAVKESCVFFSRLSQHQRNYSMMLFYRMQKKLSLSGAALNLNRKTKTAILFHVELVSMIL